MTILCLVKSVYKMYMYNKVGADLLANYRGTGDGDMIGGSVYGELESFIHSLCSVFLPKNALWS